MEWGDAAGAGAEHPEVWVQGKAPCLPRIPCLEDRSCLFSLCLTFSPLQGCWNRRGNRRRLHLGSHPGAGTAAVQPDGGSCSRAVLVCFPSVGS